MQGIEILIVYFTIYSFIGWLCEVIYCSVLSKKLVNRGFLAGPVCPVYGFGALSILWLLSPVSYSIPIIFLSSMMITSIVEYITGWLLETFFGTRWWDYSDRKFNLEGRICLKNSVYFGIMGVLLIKVIHPGIKYLVSNIPYLYLDILCICIAVGFIIDCIFTLNTLMKLNERLRKLYDFTEELRRNTDIKEWFNEQEFLKSFDKLKTILDEGKAGINQKIELGKQSITTKLEEGKSSIHNKIEDSKKELYKKLRDKFEELTNKKGSGFRLIKAFPGMRSVKYNVQLGHLREALKEIKDRVKSK